MTLSFIYNNKNKNPISRTVLTAILKSVYNQSCFHFGLALQLISFYQKGARRSLGIPPWVLNYLEPFARPFLICFFLTIITNIATVLTVCKSKTNR